MVADHPFQHLVVPIDVSNDTKTVSTIVRRLVRPGDDVTFLHVIQPIKTARILLPKSVSIEPIARGIREDARLRLDQALEEARLPAGVRRHSIIVDGNPGEEIVQYVLRHGVTMVVMESAGRVVASRMAIGSVADHVARSAAIPLVLVRESAAGSNCTGALKRIVVPLDGSNRAKLAISSAIRLSLMLDVPVRLVSVSAVDKYASALGARSSLVADEPASSDSRQLRAMLRATEAELASLGIDVSTAIYFGVVAQSIQDALWPGDLVVMANHARSGIRPWKLGRLAEQLIRKGNAHVMLVPALDPIEDDNAHLNTVASL